MVRMSRDMKRRVSTVVTIAKTVFHWGFIPTVLYLGTYWLDLNGMPENCRTPPQMWLCGAHWDITHFEAIFSVANQLSVS